LIGSQPEAPELSLADVQRRFSEVLRRFLGTLASQRPLVLFVDDLQWANPGTVELLAELLGDERVQHLLVVVAYRPAEAQPVLRESLRTTGGRDVTLSLRPLSTRAVTNLVADALGREAPDVAPLAHHLQERSGGNPFFLTQLLTSLQADGVIAFDRPTGAWHWDHEKLGPAEATNSSTSRTLACSAFPSARASCSPRPPASAGRSSSLSSPRSPAPRRRRSRRGSSPQGARI